MEQLLLQLLPMLLGSESSTNPINWIGGKHIFSKIGNILPILMRTGYGLYSLNQAKKYGAAERPNYEIADMLLEAINKAQGETHRNPYTETLKPLLDSSMADMVSMTKEGAATSGQVLGGVNDLYDKNLRALLGVQEKDIQFNQNATANLLKMLTLGAVEQKNQWEWDKKTPYASSMLKAAEAEKAGWENLMYAGDTVAGINRQKNIDVNGTNKSNSTDLLMQLLMNSGGGKNGNISNRALDLGYGTGVMS